MRSISLLSFLLVSSLVAALPGVSKAAADRRRGNLDCNFCPDSATFATDFYYFGTEHWSPYDQLVCEVRKSTWGNANTR